MNNAFFIREKKRKNVYFVTKLEIKIKKTIQQ